MNRTRFRKDRLSAKRRRSRLAMAVNVALLTLLVNAKSGNGNRTVGFIQGFPVCDHRLIGKESCRLEYGSKV